jgi:opacity protein-like surface antigen
VSTWDAGFHGELAIGYKPDPGLALEAGVGWLQTGRGSAVDVRVIPVSLGIRGTYPVGAFQPYALLGLGIYFVREEVGDLSDDAASIGAFLGIGGTVDLSRSFFLGLEGRYLFMPAKTFGTTTHLDGVTVTLGAGVRF